MYTIGCHINDFRRCTDVLKHSRSTPLDFDFYKQDKDFYIFSFEVDYDDFQEIVIHLKQNGVTTIGADEQLTERNIMKLTNLIKEQHKPQNPPQYNTDNDAPSQGFEKKEKNISTVIDMLTNILKAWEVKEYNSDKERYEEYYMDIEDLVTDF